MIDCFFFKLDSISYVSKKHFPRENKPQTANKIRELEEMQTQVKRMLEKILSIFSTIKLTG